MGNYDWDAHTAGHVDGCQQGAGVAAVVYTSLWYILDTWYLATICN